MTGSLLGVAGTAAAPGVTFTGNSSTGMFGATTNQLGFATAGLERLRIDNVGNVGIGTQSPTSSLSFNGTAARTIGVERNSAGSGNELRIEAGGAANGATNAGGGTLVLSAGRATGDGGSNLYFETATSNPRTRRTEASLFT